MMLTFSVLGKLRASLLFAYLASDHMRSSSMKNEYAIIERATDKGTIKTEQSNHLVSKSISYRSFLN